jgi:molybdopterin-guanine dinucleotide biosynthesis protein A
VIGPYDAIVLAGGASRRLGGVDKAMVRIGEVSMLERALRACTGAQRRIVVGPTRPGITALWCREEPPGEGPVAALAAGLELVRTPILALLACDLPYATAETVRMLVDAAAGDGAILVDAGGRDQPLAGAYQAASLVQALHALGPPYAGVAMRSLVQRLDVVRMPDPAGASIDCDTWEDVEVARHGR